MVKIKDVKSQICEYQVLTKKIVFVDGLTRVGKTMLCTLLAYLRNVSTPQMIAPLEQLLPMYATGHMDRNALSAYLRLLFNERLYNFNLSRDANFRYDDLTSVHTSYRTKELFRNLGKADGQAIIDGMEKDTDIFQFMTHDLLTHYSLFKDLNIDAKVLELMRHPVDTVHSWYVRGWGERFDNEDPRSGTTLFKFGVATIPHYALGVEEQYLSLNPVEKCLFIHDRLLDKSLTQYQQLSAVDKSQILLINFEDILQQPSHQIDRICRFIHSEPSEYIEKAFHDARLPRNFDPTDEREKKLRFIKDNVSDSLYQSLLSLAGRYESNCYDLKN
jgi:hypothetical protein